MKLGIPKSNIVRGLILFVLGVWGSLKVQGYFNKEELSPKTQIENIASKCSKVTLIDIPNTVKIKSKIEVIDGSIGANLNYCSHEIKSFEKMDIYDCSFTIGNVEYNLRKKYNFNQEGKLESYWSYKSEGPLIYSEKDLENDPKFLNYIGGMNLSVKVFENKIIDSKDSFLVEKIFDKQKLIFIKPKTADSKGERTIYLYE